MPPRITRAEITRIISDGSFSERYQLMESGKCPPELLYPERVFREQVQKWSMSSDTPFLDLIKSGLCTERHLDTILQEKHLAEVLKLLLDKYSPRKLGKTKVTRAISRTYYNLSDDLVAMIWARDPEALFSYRNLPPLYVNRLLKSGALSEDGTDANSRSVDLKHLPDSVYPLRVEAHMIRARLREYGRGSSSGSPALRDNALRDLFRVKDPQILRDVYAEVGHSTQVSMLRHPHLPLDLLMRYESKHLYISDFQVEQDWHYNIIHNPNCPVSLLRRVWKAAVESQSGARTTIAMAKMPYLPLDLLGTPDLGWYDVGHKASFYTALLENPQTPATVVAKLAWIITAWGHEVYHRRKMVKALQTRVEASELHQIRRMVRLYFGKIDPLDFGDA